MSEQQPRREVVPMDRAIWQSETAKTYQCPFCFHGVKTQYEGDDPAFIRECPGPLEAHIVEWPEAVNASKHHKS